MTEHRQKCSRCGNINVSEIIPQDKKSRQGSVIESTQPMQPDINFAKGLYQTIFNKSHIPISKNISDGILDVWHQTFDRKQQRINSLNIKDIKYYKQIAIMIKNGHHWSIANIVKHTSAKGNKARAIHNKFKECLYIEIDDGNNTTVTNFGERFLERVLRNY